MAYVHMYLTLREAPYIAAALDEYRENHEEIGGLLNIRLRQLSSQLRDMSERGLQRETELEQKRWGRR